MCVDQVAVDQIVEEGRVGSGLGDGGRWWRGFMKVDNWSERVRIAEIGEIGAHLSRDLGMPVC